MAPSLTSSATSLFVLTHTRLTSQSSCFQLPLFFTLQCRRGHGRTWTHWTPEEDKVLVAMRMKKRSWSEIAPHLPGRTEQTISVRWSKVGPRSQDGRLLVYCGPRPHYTAKEDENFESAKSLRKYKYTETLKNLPERSTNSLKNHYAKHTQPRVQSWEKSNQRKHYTAEDIRHIISLRRDQKLHFHEIAARVGRSLPAILEQIRKHTRNTEVMPDILPFSAWTPQEDSKLIELRKQGTTVSQMADHFPHRTIRSISQRLFQNRDQTGARRHRSPSEVAETQKKLLALRDKGASMKDLHQQYPGTPPRTIGNLYYSAKKKREAEQQGQSGGLPDSHGAEKS